MSYADDWHDMSDYVVHFTKEGPAKRTAYDNIMSILGGLKLEAKAAYGLARKGPGTEESQRAICFSEVPLGMLSRLVKRRSRYGVGFTKRFVTANGGAPIWYVEKDGPQHKALKQVFREVRRGATPLADHPLLRVMPFIDLMGTFGKTRHRWDWEREWRVVGDMRFTEGDVAFLFIPEEDHEAAWDFFSRYVVREHIGPSYTCPFLDPTWSIERIKQEFEEHKDRLKALAENPPLRGWWR